MVGQVPPTDRFGKQNAEREKTQRRVRDALRTDGSQFVRLYEKMQALIANLETTVSDLVNSLVPALTYTKTQIDNKIASPGAISPSSVTASGTVSVGGQFLNPDSATYNITGPRLTLWVETATGRHGNTASSRRYKTNERPVDIDPLAVLAIEPRMFNYIAELRKRDDPTFEHYVGPEYDVAEEVGLMAEDLHAAGLRHLVYYEDVDGHMVPASVDYVMWSVTLHVALRHVAAETTRSRADIAAIAAHLNLDLGSESP